MVALSIYLQMSDSHDIGELSFGKEVVGLFLLSEVSRFESAFSYFKHFQRY